MTTAWLVPGARYVFELAAVLAVGAGLLGLWRKSVEALIAAAGLLFGTLFGAVAVSVLYSPGFADRTILAATVGWVIVCAAAATFGMRLLRERMVWHRVTGAAAIVSVVVLASGMAFTTVAMVRSADKMHWRDLAHDVGRVSSLGYPVVLYPGAAMLTQVDVYEPGLVVGTPLGIDGDQPITREKIARQDGSLPAAVWYAYFPFADENARAQELSSLGYVRTMHDYYWNPLFLDLYEQRGQLARSPVPIPDVASLSAAAATIDADGSLYTIDAGVVLPIGAEVDETALISCLAPDGSIAGDVPPRNQRERLAGNGRLQHISLTTLCPVGTTQMSIDAGPVTSVGGRLIDISLSRLDVP